MPITVYYNGIKHEIQYPGEIITSKLHRDDGPTRKDPNGDEYWYKNGNLHRDGDEPAYISPDGKKSWWKNGERHRDNDKPAVIWNDGELWWYQNGVLHRDGDMPAIIRKNGQMRWWKHGNQYFYFKFAHLISLQLFLKCLYNNRKNKQIWNPDYLVGKIIKSELMKLVELVS